MAGRNDDAVRFRIGLAEEMRRDPEPLHGNNGEEADYPFVANYTKGLPHDEVGEVEAGAYRRLLRAVATRKPADFEAIPLGLPAQPRLLGNPQAGLAYDTEGPDCQSPAIPPAPRIDSAQNSAEMVELYWMALLRDVPFADFSSSTVGEATAELSRLTDYRAPKKGGQVTPETLFRGDSPGDLRGPYISQFLWHDIRYATLCVKQMHASAPPEQDYMADFGEWLMVQNGRSFPAVRPCDAYSTRKYIQTPRDITTYVHFDRLDEAYLNACFIMLDMGVPFDDGNPYRHSANQEAFATYGSPHVLTLMTEAATRALKAMWFQKWFVHRRMRPEEFGGRIHAHKARVREYPQINTEVLDSLALNRVFEKHGGHLLPQAYPEGSPTHPAYAAGHATVAGACVTVLKAWFEESFVINEPLVPTPDGSALTPYTGPDQLTIAGELNKLAANIAIARNMAGVHWRTDYTAAMRLGEDIALRLLRDHIRSTHEDAGLSITRFDGTRVTITR